MGPLIHEDLLPLIAEVPLHHHQGPCCFVSSLLLDWRLLPKLKEEEDSEGKESSLSRQQVHGTTYP
ncbi:hypothetical protein PGB90_009280 [Kerria lacca]